MNFDEYSNRLPLAVNAGGSVIENLLAASRVVRQRTDYLLNRSESSDAKHGGSWPLPDAVRADAVGGLVDQTGAIRQIVDHMTAVDKMIALTESGDELLAFQHALLDLTSCMLQIHPNSDLLRQCRAAIAAWDAVELESTPPSWLGLDRKAMRSPRVEHSALRVFDEWMGGWGCALSIPRHIQPNLSATELGVVIDNSCDLSWEDAYVLDLGVSGMPTQQADFFVAGGRSNGYSTYWGFVCRSGRVLVALQVSPDSESVFARQVIDCFETWLAPYCDHPSPEADVRVAVVYSSFRDLGPSLLVPAEGEVWEGCLHGWREARSVAEADSAYEAQTATQRFYTELCDLVAQ